MEAVNVQRIAECPACSLPMTSFDISAEVTFDACNRIILKLLRMHGRGAVPGQLCLSQDTAGAKAVQQDTGDDMLLMLLETEIENTRGSYREYKRARLRQAGENLLEKLHRHLQQAMFGVPRFRHDLSRP